MKNYNVFGEESLGESSEEQKDDFLEILRGKLTKYYNLKDSWKEWSFQHETCEVVIKELAELIDQYKKVSSPTSEAPEEQEELWTEVINELSCDPSSLMEIYIPMMIRQYTIHRKRD